MRRKIIGAVAGLALASIGTFALVAYVNTAEDRALAGERTSDVLVVADKVQAGTPAADLADHVTTERLPAKAMADGAVNDLGDLRGLVTAVDLVPGEQVIADRFVAREDLGSTDAPDGMLEVTVSLEPQRALGGMVVAGDTVGVIASFDPFQTGGGATEPNSTHLILHKVLVTRVQTSSPAPSSDDEQATTAPRGSFLVTLALDAPSVERVVFAAEHGFLWLSQEPRDAPEDGTRVWTREVIY